MATPNAPLVMKGGPAAGRLLAKVDAMSGTQVEACYQCGKCSGGCPLAFAMDYQPRQIMRLVQLGLEDEALASSTIWVCATCFTCTARCPRDIDIAGVMDALRVLATRRGLRPGDRNIGAFHRAFLDSVRRFGRGYELGLMLLYKLRTLRLTEDMGLGLKMLAKGKLALLPETAKGRAEVEAIFREAAEGARKAAEDSPETAEGAAAGPGRSKGAAGGDVR
ncbi:MAG: 4Fe-4S dicluster domain-containing protein [Bacillota bacterium]|jgi:heterodisulfide reductase subunit C